MATQTTKTNVYEGMFLFPQSVTSNLQDAIDHIHQLLDRADAEIISLRKWDERKLAYEIKGNKRGVYFLVYFNAVPDKMADVERASTLSESLLRSLITRADHLTQDQLQAADGRAELADEIKLRSEQGDAAGESTSEGSSVVESRSEREARLAAEQAAKSREKAKAQSDEEQSSDDDESSREPAVAGAKNADTGR